MRCFALGNGLWLQGPPARYMYVTCARVMSCSLCWRPPRSSMKARPMLTQALLGHRVATRRAWVIERAHGVSTVLAFRDGAVEGAAEYDNGAQMAQTSMPQVLLRAPLAPYFISS